jgi:hypothetical protein
MTLSDAGINLIIIRLLELSQHYLINYPESLMTSCFRRAMPLFITFHLPIFACPIFLHDIFRNTVTALRKLDQYIVNKFSGIAMK